MTVTAAAPRYGCESATNGCTRWFDDHSRYAYSELHRDEKAETVTGFVERGLAHFAEQGIETKRLMSDNA